MKRIGNLMPLIVCPENLREAFRIGSNVSKVKQKHIF
jgi:hypothetical protein